MTSPNALDGRGLQQACSSPPSLAGRVGRQPVALSLIGEPDWLSVQQTWRRSHTAAPLSMHISLPTSCPWQGGNLATRWPGCQCQLPTRASLEHSRPVLRPCWQGRVQELNAAPCSLWAWAVTTPPNWCALQSSPTAALLYAHGAAVMDALQRTEPWLSGNMKQHTQQVASLPILRSCMYDQGVVLGATARCQALQHTCGRSLVMQQMSRTQECDMTLNTCVWCRRQPSLMPGAAAVPVQALQGPPTR